MEKKDKFTYTAEDAAGCTISTPDIKKMVCRDCILNINLGQCLKYPHIKPENIFNGGKCEYIRNK